MLQKNTENKITGIFHEETFEVSNLIISLSMFYSSVEREEKELITSTERKSYQPVLFCTYVSIPSRLAAEYWGHSEGWAEVHAG